MNIGQFNKRISLQSRSATLDDYGQQLASWSTVATVWANIKPIGGREKLRAMAVESELTHTVAIRYRASFLPPTTVDAWRISYASASGTRIFNIVAARDLDEAHEYIVFDCVEGSLDGQ
jgi:SPP1 family predicted phage head-tail adaptor